MGKIRVRHFVEKPSGLYFQATPAMKAAGIHSESLGRDMTAALARAEFLNGEWDRIRQGDVTAAKPPAPRGTVARLIQDLRADPEYSDKKPRTREELDSSLTIVEDTLGRFPVTAITPERCKKFYAGLRVRGSVHYAAKHFKWFRYLLGYALRMQQVDSNASLAVRVKHPNSREAIWTEDQINAALAAADELGYPAMRIAIMIGYDTSLRPSDIRALRWKQFDGESLWVVVEKTGKPHRVPLYPETVEALKAHRRLGGVIRHDESHVILSKRRRPYTKDGFTHVFREIATKAGIPATLQFRDIRRTASAERAAAGATEVELAGSTGHSIGRSSKILDVYNPRSYEHAKTAQAKRRRHKDELEQEKNAGEAEV